MKYNGGKKGRKTMKQIYDFNLSRIAKALERIADAMEEANKG